MHTYSSHTVQPVRQTGVVLVVALVMLLLITIVGVSAVKTLTLEERMTSNSIDRNTVFQTTEWGLSLAEQVAEAQAKQCNAGFANGGGVQTVTTTDESNGNGNGNGNGEVAVVPKGETNGIKVEKKETVVSPTPAPPPAPAAVASS